MNRGLLAAFREARAAVRCFASQKIAVIQDQQIPKDEALTALSKKGFDVTWASGLLEN